MGDPVSVLHVLLKSSSRALDNQFLTPDMSLASETAKCQGATNANCRLADLHTCRRGAIADLPTCILLDFRDFENVTELTANSVLGLLVPQDAADSLARTVMW